MLRNFCDRRGAEGRKVDRYRQELSNEHFLGKIGVDTDENEPLKVHVIFKLCDSIDRAAPAAGVHAAGGPSGGRRRWRVVPTAPCVSCGVVGTPTKGGPATQTQRIEIS